MRMSRSRVNQPVSVLIREEMAAANGNAEIDNEQGEKELAVEQNDDQQPNRNRGPRSSVTLARVLKFNHVNPRLLQYVTYIRENHVELRVEQYRSLMDYVDN